MGLDMDKEMKKFYTKKLYTKYDTTVQLITIILLLSRFDLALKIVFLVIWRVVVKQFNKKVIPYMKKLEVKK